MSNEQTIAVLNHLVAIQNRSLPVYLQSAHPYAKRADDPRLAAIAAVAAAENAVVERIGHKIIDLDGVVLHGEFPHRFADWHDLSIDFLLAKSIELQELDIQRIQRCVGWLDRAPRAKALAEETLGEAKAHLETLCEAQSAAVA